MFSRKSLVLTILASAIVFGYGYCLDILQALQVYFRQEPYEFSTLQFNLMYFFTFLPIFIFNIPIGTIIDRNEITVSLFSLLIMSLGSQVVMTIMVWLRIPGYIFIMYAMRSVFGVAGEGIFTVQGMIITNYCKQNFEIVMSVALSLPFIFDSINSLLTTHIYDWTEAMVIPYLIGVIVCIISLLSGFLVIKLYVKPPNKIKKNQESLISQNSIEDNQQNEISQSDSSQEQESSFSLRQLKSFSSIFWILIASGFFTQASLGSFLDNCNDLLVKRFNIPYTDAGLLLIIPYSFLALFSIFFSVIMTKWPKTRRPTYVGSTLLYLIGQMLLYFLPQASEPTIYSYVIIGFFCLTLSLSLSVYYTGIIASIPYVVERTSVGTAFGVIGCFVGLSQCTTPFMNIAIINSDPDLAVSYKSLNLVYIFIAYIAFCFAIYINWGPFQALDRRFEDVQKEWKDQEKRLKQLKKSAMISA